MLKKTSGLHFRAKITPKELIFFIGSFMIWLFLSQAAVYAQSAEKGEQFYQQFNCHTCHTIGGGRLVGPDLKGVTSKRDQSWLIRWITHPDKMLAEGDPLAKQIFAEFNNIPMPPSGVNEAQTKDILAYIEAKSSGTSSPPATTTPVADDTVQPAPETAPQSSSNIQAGKAIFEQKCGACHTIGSGRKVGPDLKGVTVRRDKNWLLRWIQEPDVMLAEGDAIATQLLQDFGHFPMPNFGLSETQATDLVAYLEAEGAGIPATVQSSISVSVPGLTGRGDPKLGKILFMGQKPFANGGPACMSCHTTTEVGGLGGGTLGLDLTKVHSRYGGDIGLNSVLVSTPFPTMLPIFGKQPVLDSEAAHLTAYFALTDSMDEKGTDFGFIGIGILGVILFYILVHLIWKKRLTGVRIPMVGR